MRVKEVEFAGKKVTVRELKIKELNKMVEQIGVDFDSLFKSGNVVDMQKALTSLLQDKLPMMFKEVKKADVEEAYPSEIEELIGAFVDTNFSGLKKVILPLLKLSQKL